METITDRIRKRDAWLAKYGYGQGDLELDRQLLNEWYEIQKEGKRQDRLMPERGVR